MEEKSAASGAPPGPRRADRPTVAFLLTQVGTHAAGKFADRVASLGLSPPQVGMLRWIAQQPGNSQQAIAKHFDIQPSRVVTFVDELEERGLAQRGRDPHDRRVRTVELTAQGKQVMRDVRRLITEHDADITATLTGDEREQLRGLLERLAERVDLPPGVHPGYRHITARPGQD